ncbi:MAG: prolyl oligopeptidase family serine peptidase [bacterium]|nr:prolyl oligopeptidase family serine peptidase [bacterium]
MLKYFACAALSLLSLNALSQDYPNASSLDLRAIMQGHDFVGHLPENAHWSLTGEHILFDWNPDAEPGNSLYSYNLKTKSTNIITPEFYKNNTDFWGGSASDYTYFIENGALYHFDFKNKQSELIYRSANRVSNVQYHSGSDYVYFQEGDEIKAYCIDNKCIETIFIFKDGDAPSKKESSESHWEKEERQLFEFIREQEEAKQWRKKKRSAWTNTIPSFHKGKEQVSNVQLSPDGRFLTFRLYTKADAENTHVEHHISADGHTYTSNARAKVHDNDPNNRLAIHDFEKDTTYFVDFSTLEDIRKKPAYLSEYGDTEAMYEQDRNIVMHRVIYAEGKNTNVMDVRSYDNKDRWIVSINLEDGTLVQREHQHDEAWIGGPGISNWNMVSGTLGWLQDGKTFYFQSEESGYSHLYEHEITSGRQTAVTSGNWEVHDVTLSSDGSTYFVTTNETHPGDKGFYHIDVKTHKRTPILTKSGAHEVSISPDEKWLAVRYSYKNKPWELYIAPNKAGAELQQITSSTSNVFAQYSWHEPEVMTFKASDGATVHARLYEPDEGLKTDAAVIFVHGAGYLQNAHNWWSTYFREYMFHNLLRDNGITVLDIDYRASAGYGRDHRTAIYRHMGGKDLSDQVDGRQWLIDSLGINPDKVGIYGGSYGGFITLMALLKEPGKFQGGAALRSVTDWYHYNHEYTSNILNYPTTDTLAYERSSPIYFADNLEDRLVMLHGMVDDNVQFQDVVRLSQRFIEVGKDNWELAVFPVEAHSFQKGYSWADEYRRIYELFMDELILKKQ